MNKQISKIKRKIAEKKKQLANIKTAVKRQDEEGLKKFEQDYKLLNILNPFYKKQYNPLSDFAVMAILASEEVRLEQEIKELNDLSK